MSERIRRTRRGRPARRVYFFKQRAAYARLEDGLGDAWTDKRLAEPGTPLPVTFPWRAAAIAAGVLAIEDIDGASIVALTTLGSTSLYAVLLPRAIGEGGDLARCYRAEILGSIAGALALLGLADNRARSAVGVAVLPRNAAVEVEFVVSVRDPAPSSPPQ